MKEIGGYFNLELRHNECPLHRNGVFLNSGRNSFEYILRSIPQLSKVLLPYFTCDVVLEPLIKLDIPYAFYHINESLELIDKVELGDNEYLLYTNYFGIKDLYIEHLQSIYSSQLIVDNSQALFASPTEYSFYSPRKFLGLPDGGIAYSKHELDVSGFDIDYSSNRCSHLLKRYELPASEGYLDFKENSLYLQNQPIRRISTLTKAIYDNIDYQAIMRARLDNFAYLHSFLKNSNRLKLNIEGLVSPLIYPYYVDNEYLREILINHKIYIALYWPNVLKWCKSDDLEYCLAKRILPLPIDQRYGQTEMRFIINTINENGI